MIAAMQDVGHPLQPLTVVLGEDERVAFRINAAIFPPVGSTIEVPGQVGTGSVAKVLAVRLCWGQDPPGFYVAVVTDFAPHGLRAPSRGIPNAPPGGPSRALILPDVTTTIPACPPFAKCSALIVPPPRPKMGTCIDAERTTLTHSFCR